jgi:hypothetical protein
MRNNLVIVVGVVVVSCMLISLFVGGRAVGQQKDAPASVTGRYQMAVGQAQFGHVIVVLDTQTGQVWQRYHNDNNWSDLGSPIPKAKAKKK